MYRTIGYLMAVFCCLVFSVSCIFEDAGAEVAVGDRIPGFSVTMNDGTAVDAESLEGKVSCIVFFNTECPDCRTAMPVIQKLYDEFSGQVVFVPISRAETEASIAGHWKEEGFTMPYSAQKDRVVYNLFASSGIPRVYLGDRDGIIRFIHDDDPLPAYAPLKSELISLLK